MDSKLGDPAHWRARADEARQIAENFRDEGARKQMLEVADSCDQIADRVERLKIANGNHR